MIKSDDNFWKQKIRDYMHLTNYQYATNLAIDCAIDLDHDEWLDDPDHFVWEIALEYCKDYSNS